MHAITQNRKNGRMTASSELGQLLPGFQVCGIFNFVSVSGTRTIPEMDTKLKLPLKLKKTGLIFNVFGFSEIPLPPITKKGSQYIWNYVNTA